MSIRIYAGVTDTTWFDFLHGRPELDEVNFWRPGGGISHAERGTLFLFKLKTPRSAIGGGGFVEYSQAMSVRDAWEFYGSKNGTGSLTELKKLIAKNAKHEVTDDTRIGCIILDEPFFLPRNLWVTAPEDWAAQIVAGKFYETTSAIGSRLWRDVQARLPGAQPALSAIFGGVGAPAMYVPRQGQGTFRKLVLAAYENRCAVTGERTIPVLQASHIKPFSDVRGHEVQNGIALRSDIHTLFDRGYVTVTSDRRFRVSSKLREDFSNGGIYYAHDGQEIRLPIDPLLRPNDDYLAWHRDQVFKK